MHPVISLPDAYHGYQTKGDPLPTLAACTRLSELTVRHQGVSGMRPFVTLTAWLTILVIPSRLTSLTIISDDGKLCMNANDFVACLPRTQSMNLQILRVSGFLFNGLDLRTVLSWKRLEVLEFRLEDTLALVRVHHFAPHTIPNISNRMLASHYQIQSSSYQI